MKTWKIAAFAVSAACLSLATACKDAQNNTDAAKAQAPAVSDTLTVDDILASADSLVGKEIVFEGVCTHICSHGGGKIFLMGSDDSKMLRAEASKELGSFKKECVNSIVAVKGKVVEDRIDEAYLAEWEREVKDQLAEQHGEGEAGCSAEQQARGESVASSVGERIAGFRTRIADRKAKEGKEYLSFYHVEGGNYEVLE